MLKKFLKDVMIMVVGKQAEEIADLLEGKKYVNEFIIAKKLNLTINQTRNILYKISDHGLVSFIRKKDKRKGWYTYFWKIEILKCLEFLRGGILKKMDQIHHQVKSRETKEFYVCERCNIEFNEENALLYNFICNECGNVFTRKDNAPLLKEFNRDLDKLRKELELVEKEIKEEKDRLDKVKVRELKKEEKMKKKTKKIVKKTKKTKNKKSKIKKKIKKIKRKKPKKSKKKIKKKKK
ncbi:MAG: hypothetical protein NTU63_02660 [Candidatus Pacearchaeota archaeon]|nr:hypothetical protein [Candidatus Pacearchaeota archaeon]